MKPALQRLFPFFPPCSLFFSFFLFFFLTSPAGRRACPVCVKLVSLNANAMSLGGNFVVLHKGTSKSYHKSVHREIPGVLGLGVWLRAHTHTHTHTQEKLWRSCGFAHAKWHIRCLTAWESVSIKPHNQWGPFKVLEMASDKCHFLSMSPLQVRCIPRAAAPGGIQLDNARDSKGDLLRGFYLCQWQGHTHVWAQKNHSQRKAVVQSDHIQSTCAFACCHWSQKKKKVLVMTRAADEMDFPLFRPDMTTRRMNKSKRGG